MALAQQPLQLMRATGQLSCSRCRHRVPANSLVIYELVHQYQHLACLDPFTLRSQAPARDYSLITGWQYLTAEEKQHVTKELDTVYTGAETLVAHAPADSDTLSTVRSAPAAAARTQAAALTVSMSTAPAAINELWLPKPDDFHLHLRDGGVLADTATAAALQFHYATIMPNLQPPVTTAQQAVDYRARILAAIRQPAPAFHPLMTLYLTNHTTPEQIREAQAAGNIHACKLYPAGATTHSAAGVSLHDSSALTRLGPTFAAMAECGLLLLIHGEVTESAVDIFKREAQFLTQFLPSLMAAHPTLRIVLEHITTAEAVAFVQSQPSVPIAATITAHHLLANRNLIFQGGLNPHAYCLPVLKAERHRQALLAAATSDSDRFFAGTDSAPHSRHRKLQEGCAGCYTAYGAAELYAEAFDEVGRLDKLQAFMCERGRRWYGLPLNEANAQGKVLLRREEWVVPSTLPFGEEEVVPFWAGKTLHWKLVTPQGRQQ